MGNWKVTVRLASHWPCVTDNSGIAITCGLTALGRQISIPLYASSWPAENMQEGIRVCFDFHKTSYSFIQNCCWISLQLSHHEVWNNVCQKMEGKTNFSRRLEQFDGLTWLTLTPAPLILRHIYITCCCCLGDAASSHVTYRPYFHAHPSSSWVASPGELSIGKCPGPYSFHPAWMPDGAGAGSGGAAAAAAAAAAMSRSWTMSGGGATSGGLPHHQQSLHHRHQHPHQQHHHQQQSHQQNLLHQQTSALFQPMVTALLLLSGTSAKKAVIFYFWKKLLFYLLFSYDTIILISDYFQFLKY